MVQARRADLRGEPEQVRQGRAVVAHQGVRAGAGGAGDGGDVEGQPAAEAEPEHADRPVHRRVVLQGVEGGGAVADGGLPVELAEQLHRAGEPVGGLADDLVADPPVEVRDQHDVAEVGEVLGAAADVVGDAEDLLEEHDPRAGAGLGQVEVGGDLAVGDGDGVAGEVLAVVMPPT